MVQPAAFLPDLAKKTGATIVEINTEKTPLTPRTDHFIKRKAGESLKEIRESL